MLLADVAVETVLLILKIAFLVLLYLFIWRIVRAAGRDLRVPSDTIMLAPGHGGAGLTVTTPRVGRLIVEESPTLDRGVHFDVDSAAVTVGRSSGNDIAIDGDEFASARHARVEPRRDGVWVYDLGSTNGTYVNGTQIDRPRRLAPGDVLRVGETDLRFEQ